MDKINTQRAIPMGNSRHQPKTMLQLWLVNDISEFTLWCTNVAI